MVSGQTGLLMLIRTYQKLWFIRRQRRKYFKRIRCCMLVMMITMITLMLMMTKKEKRKIESLILQLSCLYKLSWHGMARQGNGMGVYSFVRMAMGSKGEEIKYIISKFIRKIFGSLPAEEYIYIFVYICS